MKDKYYIEKYKYYIEMLYNSAAISLDTVLPFNHYYSVRLLKNFTVSETIEDYDGNIYHVIYIGTQKWLLENLKVTHYRDGTARPNLTVGADWIQGYSGVTYSDYFLPSVDEMQAMHDNLYNFGLCNFDTDDIYWTSTDIAASSAKGELVLFVLSQLV